MLTIGYKELSNCKFSNYPGIYSNTGEGKGKPNYELSKIYVDRDCSDSGTRISEADKDKLKIIKVLRNKRENEFSATRFKTKKSGLRIRKLIKQ